MRLLNVHTYELEQFLGDRVPDYAILSHTWGEDEVTFEDIDPRERKLTALLGGRSAESKQGWRKIQFTCVQANADGLQYAWVDTCCIDKRSSAELSEAINSMYRWYERSKVCYAYLADIKKARSSESPLQSSRWFTRGWTLQELLAPETIKFYDAHWNLLGIKEQPKHGSHGRRHSTSSKGLNETLSSATGISMQVLDGRMRIQSCSVACRMSWASSRTTSRVEDIAYCLLGIFDVNMPLLYGEGHKAFFRLQEAISQKQSDQSLLAWGFEKSRDHRIIESLHSIGLETGLWLSSLARSPSDFRSSASMLPVPTGSQDIFQVPHEEFMTITPSGLRITAPILQAYDSLKSGVVTLAILGCVSEKHPEYCVAICLFNDENFDVENIPTRLSRRRLERDILGGGGRRRLKTDILVEMAILGGGGSTVLLPLSEAKHAKVRTIHIEIHYTPSIHGIESIPRFGLYNPHAILMIPNMVANICDVQHRIIRPADAQVRKLEAEDNAIDCRKLEVSWTPGVELEIGLRFGLGLSWMDLLVLLSDSVTTIELGTGAELDPDNDDNLSRKSFIGIGLKVTLTRQDLAVFNHRYRQIEVLVSKLDQQR